ncbi:hypothetical protein K9M79_08475 [Candidatus Woesearchaeota archaeon]|nr:hypothetical protein [Candidatus Woesearchaeota archaeon]
MKAYIVIILLLVLLGCQSGLTVESTAFARNDNGTITYLDDAVYHKNETIIMALINVGEFEKSQQGYHWIDLDVEITDDDGEKFADSKMILGGMGKAIFPDNIAPNPYGSFSPMEHMPAGEYNMKLTIYDMNSGATATATDRFKLID